MKKQVFFGFLFCSWILGVSLICLFPPIPDYKVSDVDSGYLSQDSVSDLHLRNASKSGVFQVDLDFKISDLIAELQFKPVWKVLFAFVLSPHTIEISSFFDTKILFKAFFETW